MDFFTTHSSHLLRQYDKKFQFFSLNKFFFFLLLLDPFYPLDYLYGTKLSHLFEIFSQTSFFCCILLFWICFFHGIRQNKRNFLRFYVPKLKLVGSIWIIIFYASAWSRLGKMDDPTLDEESAFRQSSMLKVNVESINVI